MDVIIADGHGQVAILLETLLVERGHHVRGLIRKPEQAEDLQEIGAEPVLFDLEYDEDVERILEGADAIVFAAGAGPGSGVEQKYKVDRDGAIKLIDGAKRLGIERYVMLSAMGVDDFESIEDEVFHAYMKAKSEADEVLRNSGLAYTILRPGSLTDDEGTSCVTLGREVESGEISRAHVAAVIAYTLEHPDTAGVQVELTSGDTSIEEAFERFIGRKDRPSASP